MTSLRAALALAPALALVLAACGSDVTGGEGGTSAGDLCPATDDATFTVGIQSQMDPGGSNQTTKTVAGTIAGQQAGSPSTSTATSTITVQPADGTDPVVVQYPTDLALPSWIGKSVTLTYAVDMPWWVESGFVLRDDAGGLMLAGADGTLSWTSDPMFQAADLKLSLGGSCDPVEDTCQTAINRVLNVEGGGATASLVGGHSASVTLGGKPFQVRLGRAYEGAGDMHCSDAPDSWLNVVVAPAP